MNEVRNSSDAWVVEHSRFLRRLAGVLLKDDARAEDAAQDAWLAALKAPPAHNLAGWLTTVTRRLALRSKREASRRRGREQAVARDEELPSTGDSAARAEIVRLVGEVASDLPEPFRETLLLTYWEGLAPRQVAARLDVPVATVRSRTRRALERVRTELERRSPQRWENSLALAVGLASKTTTTLGALGMKTKAWILGSAALLALALTATLAVSISSPKSSTNESVQDRLSLRDPATVMEASSPEGGADRTERVDAVGSAAASAKRASVAAPLQVRVVDALGESIDRAEVLGGPSGGHLRVVGTTVGGRLAFEPADEMRVFCARAPGFAPSPVYALPSTESATGELVLQLPRRGAPLTVEVRDPGGAPLADARVFAGREEEVDVRLADGTLARTAPGFGATTDAGGSAYFPGLSLGWLRVRVEHENYADTTAFTTLFLERENRVEIELQPGITVTGRVLDERGEPVAGADVRRGSSSRFVKSAADGSFRFGPVDAGKLVVTGPRGRRAEKRLQGDPGSVVDWDPVLPSQPAIQGRVIDDLGRVVPDWTVHACFDTWPGWQRGARTDAEGRFSIYGVPSKAMSVRIEVRKEALDDLPVLTLEGIAVGEVEHVIEVPSSPFGRVAGRAVRANPSAAASIPLFLRHRTTPQRARLTGGPGRSVNLDSDGHFTLDDVPAGGYELVVEGEPFGWWRLAELEVAPGQTNDLGTIRIPEPGTLRSRSFWGDPDPTVDARYLLERRADRVTVLDFHGTFPDELALAPGTYTLQTEVTPGPQREIEFEIREGQITEIEIDLAARCSHRVRVRYASGRIPSGRIELEVRRLDDGLTVFTDRVSDVEDSAWIANVELGSGRFEVLARGPGGLEARIVENLYTSQPERELLLSLDDAK